MAGVSGAVLVGGQSRRMGADKAMLPVGGQSLLQRVVAVLREVADELLIVGASGERTVAGLGGRSVDDLISGVGPLGGIYTALSTARYSHCLVVACDMPFLSTNLLRHLGRQAVGWDAVVPRRQEGLEPLHAVYSRSCLKPIQRMLANGVLSPLDLFPLVRVRYLETYELALYDPGGLSFVNLNTPADLALAGLMPVSSVERERPAATTEECFVAHGGSLEVRPSKVTVLADAINMREPRRPGGERRGH